MMIHEILPMLHKTTNLRTVFIEIILATAMISSFSASVQADVVVSIRPLDLFAAIADGVTPTEVYYQMGHLTRLCVKTL